MATLRIHELPEQDRPREKLAAQGAAALSDSELIAILLRTGMQGANAIDVARQLLTEFKSLSGLARCSVKELSKINGLGAVIHFCESDGSAYAEGVEFSRSQISQMPIPLLHPFLLDATDYGHVADS